MGINTQKLVKYKLSGRIAFLTLVLLLFVPVGEVLGQGWYNYTTCNTNVKVEDIFDARGLSSTGYSWDQYGSIINYEDNSTISDVSDDTFDVTGDTQIEFRNGGDRFRVKLFLSANALTINVTLNQPSSCGGQDGSISIDIFGGGGSYSWDLWNKTSSPEDHYSGSTTSNLSQNALEAGTYFYYIIDVNGCSDEAFVTLETSSTNLALSGRKSDETCIGNDGEVILSGSGGSSSYEYRQESPTQGIWTSVAIFDNLSPGSYEFSVRDANSTSCEELRAYSIEIDPYTTLSLTGSVDSHVTCNGENDGKITLSGAGGSGSYEYKMEAPSAESWTSSNTFTNLAAGTYEFSFRDAANTSCEKLNVYTVDIYEPVVLTLSGAATGVTCYGENDGTVTLTVGGGGGSYEYSIDGSTWQTSNIFSGLSGGSHGFWVKDVNGCELTINVTVPEPTSALTLTAETTDITCNGLGNGQVVLTGAGGAGNYEYGVDGNTFNTVDTYSTLGKGNYTYWVQDDNGCKESVVATINEPSKLVLTVTKTDVSCEGGVDGNASVTVSGGTLSYTYQWVSYPSGPNVPDSNGGKSAAVHDLSTGTYQVTVTDGNTCTETGSIEVNEPTGFTTNEITASHKDVSCYGGSNGAFELLTTDGEGTIEYKIDGPVSSLWSTKTYYENLPYGDYTVSARDLGTSAPDYCEKVVLTISIDQPASLPTISLVDKVNPSCYNATDGSIEITAGGGTIATDYIYEWRDLSSNIPVSSANGGDTSNPTFLSSGSYEITITDDNGCSDDEIYTLNQPEEFILTESITDVTCNGGSNGAIEINYKGGTSPSFNWTKTGDASFTSNNQSLSSLSEGVYNLEVTDGCNYSYSFTINQPEAISATPHVTDVSCNGDSDGSIQLDVTGGTGAYTYEWSPNSGGIVGSDKNQTGLSQGSYSVTIKDANNCPQTITDIDVKEPAELVSNISIKEPTSCDNEDGTITLSPSGGTSSYSYSWSSIGGSAITSGASSQSSLGGGTYNVVVTDAKGCSVTESVSFNKPIEISNVVVLPETCGGNTDGSISFDVLGGDGIYNYAWSSVSGNTWTGSANSISGLAPDTYSVIITDGSGSCSFTKDFEVISTTSLDVDIAQVNVICNGGNTGSLSTGVSGGSGDYSYSWNNGAYNTASLTDLTAGTYTLFVTDNILGCTFNGSYTITEATAIDITVDKIIDSPCMGEAKGSIQISSTGGTGTHSYTWSGPTSAGGTDPTDLLAGNYSVTVTDEKGCTAEVSNIPVGEPATHISISNPKVTDASTKGGVDGQIEVDVDGGTGSTSVEWFDASNNSVGTTNPVTGLKAGTYSVTAIDASGCSYTLEGIVVSQPDEDLTFKKLVYDVSPCYGDSNGEIKITRVYGGHPIDGTYYNIKVDGPNTSVSIDGTTLDLTSLVAGTYTVTVTDDLGATYTEDIYVDQNAELDLSTSITSHVNCYGSSTGEIEITVSGGKPDAGNNYQIQIFGDNGYYKSVNAPSVYTASGLKAGAYRVVVTDFAHENDSRITDGCSITEENIVITQPQAEVTLLPLDASSTSVCYGEYYSLSLITDNWDFTNDGNLIVTLYDGNSYDDVTVSSNSFTVLVSPTSSATYSISKVVAELDNTCDKGFGTGEVHVTVNTLPTVTLAGPSEVCEDGEVVLTVGLTGIGPWSVNWKDTNNNTSGTGIASTSTWTLTDIPSSNASYQIVSVTDANGCVNTSTNVVNVTVHAKPKVTLTSTYAICIGETATLYLDFENGAGTYTITYEVNGTEYTETITTTSGGQYVWLVTPNETTTYEITSVTDANGCVMDMTSPVITTVNVIDLSASFESIPVSCNGGIDGSLVVYVSGDVGFSYQWYKYDKVSASYIEMVGETYDRIENKTAGQYKVEVTTLSNGCIKEFESEIIEPDILSITALPIDVTSCSGSSSGGFHLEISGGEQPYSYTCGSGMTTLPVGTNTDDVSDIAAGDYTIVVTDANGCSKNVDITISEPTQLQLDIVNATIGCSVDDASWPNGVLEIEVSGGVVKNSEHSYIIELSGLNGFSSVKTISNPEGDVSTQAYSDLDSGSYIISVYDNNSTDANKCVQTDSFILEPITISGTPNNAACIDGANGTITEIVVDGASANYTGSWSSTDGGTGYDNSSLNQSGLTVGTYVLTVVDPDRGCTVEHEFAVGYDTEIIVDATITDVTCFGGTNGSIILDVQGVGSDVTYSWSGDGIDPAYQNSKDQANLPEGEYIVTIYDNTNGNSCSVIEIYTVKQPLAPVDFELTYEVTSCEPYERTIVIENITGGTGDATSGDFTFNIAGPITATPISGEYNKFTITKGGTYTVYVSDKNKCESSKSIFIPEVIDVTSVISDVKCNGGSTGAITVEISGGSNSFDYSWTGVNSFTSVNKNISNLIAGNYTLTVTDLVDNCTKEIEFYVDQPNAINITENVVDVTCNGDADGSIILDVNGGVAPYSYSWTPKDGIVETDKNQTGLGAGVYTVNVIDNVGCAVSKDITVTQDDALSVTIDIVDTECDGTNGQLDLTVYGGSGTYKYDWSKTNGDGSELDRYQEDQTGLSGGTYSVLITDADPNKSSCQLRLSATLTDAIVLNNIKTTPVSCTGSADGTISFDVTGGDGNYTYTWSTSDGDISSVVQGVTTQSGLPAGTYTVVVKDGRTSNSIYCEITHDFVIEDASELQIDIQEIINIKCYGNSTASLLASVSGGSGDYIYTWNNGTTSYINENISAGVYTILIKDNTSGCEATQTYEVTQPEGIVTTVEEPTHVTCRGDATGEIKVNVTGGTAPYTYVWSGPTSASGDNPKNLKAGIYTVTVTDQNSCSVISEDIVVTEPASYITVSNPQVTDVSVIGGNDGQILVDVTGASGTVTYEWYDENGDLVSTTNPATNLVAGLYTVVATDNPLGCAGTLSNIRVQQPDAELTVDITKYDVSPCSGDDNGSMRIFVSGGHAINGTDYNISVTGIGVNENTVGNILELTGLKAGVYNIKVTDDYGVEKTTTVTISEYTELNLSATVISNVDCYEESTGQINLLITGGRPNASGEYSVIITGDNYSKGPFLVAENINELVTVLPAGTYTIHVDDFAGDYDTKSISRGSCYAEDQVTITEPEAKVTLSAIDTDPTVCNGESYTLVLSTSNWDFVSNGNLSINIHDIVNNVDYPVIVDNSYYEYTLTPISTTAYNITEVKSSTDDCSKGIGSGDVQVVVNELPTATISTTESGLSSVCEDGTVELSVALTGVGPWQVTWQDVNNSTSQTVTVNNSPYVFTDSPVDDASYKVIAVQDANGCSNTGTGTVDVVVNPTPGVTLSGSTDICQGETTVLEIGFETNNYPYTIVYEANGVEYTMTVSPTSGSVYEWNVSPNVTTRYDITSVVDNYGCSVLYTTPVSATVTVNQLPNKVVEIFSDEDIDGVCQSGQGFDYFIDPVSNTTGYKWTAPANSTIVSGQGTTNVVLDFGSGFEGGYLRVYAKNDCGNGIAAERWIGAKPLPGAVGSITGPVAICEGSIGLIFSVDEVDNTSGYTWEVPSGFIIQGNRDGSSIIIDLDPTIDAMTGNIKVTPYNDCGNGLNKAELPVNVYPLPVAEAGLNTNVCSDTYVLDAVDPQSLNTNWSGEWTVVSGNGNVTNPTAYNSTVTGLSRGDVVLRWTVYNNNSGGEDCLVYDDVTIRNNTLTVDAKADDNVVCNGQTILSGTTISTSNTTGLWEAVYPTGSTAIFSDATAIDTEVLEMMPGRNVFRWTLTQNGCESYAEVEVINNEPSEAVILEGTRLDLCEDFVTLNATKPAVGTGRWTVISGSGVIASPNNETTEITGLRKGDNIIRYTVTQNGCAKYDDITVRNNMLDVDAGDDQAICDYTYEFNATIPEGGVSGQWRVLEGDGTFVNASLPNAVVENLSQGTNRFIWELTQNGCISSDEITIINNAPTDAIVGVDQEICADEYQLTGNSPSIGIGVWSLVQGAGRFDDASDPETMVTNMGKGINIYRWSISNQGCVRSADIEVTDLQLEVFAGKDTIVCGNSTTLNADAFDNASGTIKGEWNIDFSLGGGGSITVPNDPKTSVGGLVTGANGFIWQLNNKGCISSDEVIITNNTPSPIYAGPDQIITGGTTALNADPVVVGVGTWSLVNGSASIDDQLDPYTIVSGLQTGDNIFRWSVTNQGCLESDDVTITNGYNTEADAGVDQVLCSSEAELNANDPNVGKGEWSVVSGSGQFDEDEIGSNTARVYNLGPGENVFKWSIKYTNYTSVDYVTITNLEVSDANAGPDRSICSETYQLEAAIPAIGNVEWTLLSGGGTIKDETNPNSIVDGLANGANVMKLEVWQEQNGYRCNSTDEVIISNMLPTEAIINDDIITLCTDSFELRANTPTYGEGEWIVKEGAAVIIDGWAKELSPGRNVLSWVITNGSCSSSDDIVVINNTPSSSYAGRSRPVCEDVVRLSAQQPLYGDGYWEILSGNGIMGVVTDPNTQVTGLSQGRNRFKWVVDNEGCISTSEVEISYNYALALAGDDQMALCADTAILAANESYPYTGVWSVAGGSGLAEFEDINDPFTTVRNLDKGENTLVWTVQNGSCISTDELIVENNSPSEAIAGDNQDVCTNSAVLDAQRVSVGTALWSVRTGSGDFVDSTDPQTEVSNLNWGANIFRWTVEHMGCTSIDEVQIYYETIEATPGDDIESCKDWAVLDAATPTFGTGTWSVISGSGTFDDNHNSKATISNLSEGENVLEWVVDNGECVSSHSINVYYYTLEDADAGEDQVTCEENLILDGNQPQHGSGRWTVLRGNGTFDNPTNYNSVVRDLGFGENIYKWTVSYGDCTSEDQVIIISNKPEAFAGEDGVTNSSTYDMQAANPGEFEGEWSLVAGGGVFDDSNFFNTTVRELPEGKSTFQWTVEYEGCSASDEVVIDYQIPPETSFTADVDSGCAPLDVKFTNYSVRGTTWEWDFGDGNTSTERSPAHTFDEPGEYTIMLTGAEENGATSVSTLLISVHDYPTADFRIEPATVWLPEDPIRCIDLSIGAVNWLWNFGDGSTSNEQNPVYYYNEEGTYTISLRVENEFGCDNTYVQTDIVEANLSGFIAFPDAFAPRSNAIGIGERDDAYFKPQYRDVESFHMEIYNRWGQLVFETTDINTGWNGMYKDQLAPQAVYVYKVNGQFVNGVEFVKTGSFLLVR